MLEPRPRDPALVMIERLAAPGAADADAAAVEEIRRIHAERPRPDLRSVREAIILILTEFRMEKTHADPLLDLLVNAGGMAANESGLDADWRGRSALKQFAAQPTEDAFRTLHVLTRLKIVERALADGSVPQDERTITRRWEALGLGLFVGDAFGSAAAALAEETMPVMGRPGTPEGLRFGVETLAAFWLEHGPRRLDSRGRQRRPRVSESQKAGSFSDFAVRLLTLEGSFGEPQVRWIVRETVAARRVARKPSTSV
jgi:hypothetical protein